MVMNICDLCWCVTNPDPRGAIHQWEKEPGVKWVVCEECHTRLENGDKPSDYQGPKDWREGTKKS